MNVITIDRKKYVLIPEHEYRNLRKKAAQKTDTHKLLSLKEGKAMAYRLIDKWATEK